MFPLVQEVYRFVQKHISYSQNKVARFYVPWSILDTTFSTEHANVIKNLLKIYNARKLVQEFVYKGYYFI